MKDSRNPEELKAYIDRFPDGIYSALAKARLDALRAVPIAPPAGAAKPDAGDGFADRAFWDSVKDTKNPEELKAYLQQYPNGLFASLARTRLKAIESPRAASAAPSLGPRPPIVLRNIGLISDVLSRLNEMYLFQSDYPSLLRGAVRGLERGLLSGKLTVSEDGNGLALSVPTRGTPMPLGKAVSASDAQDQLVLVRNLAREADPSINSSRIEEAMMQGGLSALDPYSDLLTPEAFKELQVATSGVFGGVGMELSMREGWPIVVAPIEGTPAMRSGIRSGDRIASIDGLGTFNVTLNDIVKQMRGTPATRVTLGIQREGWGAPRDFPIVREVIRVQSVRSRELEPGIGYIRISQFQQGTPQSLQEALDRWAGAAIKGLVLDLRNDPGGLLNSVVEVAGKFLPEGQLVLSTESHLSEARLSFPAKSSGRQIDAPMVVMVNEGSASASEILAGALQDWKRAVVVGNRTFGKGTVQTIVPIAGGYAVKLTTAEYRTPKGRSFHATGIEPDFSISGAMPVAGDGAEDVQLQGAVTRLKQLIERR